MKLLSNLKNRIGNLLLFKARKQTNIINSVISKKSFVDGTSLVQHSQILGEVKIGPRCMFHKVHLNGKIIVGSNTSINGPGTEFFSLTNPIIIGSFCSIARHTAIQEHNHNINKITTYYIQQRVFNEKMGIDAVSKGAVVIGNDVLIGTQSVILTGINIGDGAVVAANSVVTTDIPPYSIVGGTPAKVIRKRFSEEIIKKLLEIKWWNWNIERIKRNKDLFYGDLTIEKLNNIVE